MNNIQFIQTANAIGAIIMIQLGILWLKKSARSALWN